ncbi:MAG TPA: cell envelope integrity protein CreD [Gammaproteobacteria bacterium]
MGKLLNFKVMMIASLILLLMIPLLMIRGVISERTLYRDQARQDIAQSWTGAQKLLGPLLVVPYSEEETRSLWDENLKSYKEETYISRSHLYLLPDQLSVNAKVATENRSRGLYSLPVYTSEMRLEGVFDTKPLVELAARKGGRITIGNAYLAVVVDDIRGVVVQPELNWRGVTTRFVSGSAIDNMESGMHAMVGKLSGDVVERHPFLFDMSMHGMETIEFSPVGNSTEVTMEAAWPHPSFIGRYLPAERTIERSSFNAQWRVSSFSSDMPRIVSECAQGNCQEFSANTFGVSLVNPVDIYQQTERAVKYALLFVLLTFVAFFLFEVMKQLRLHPMQYLLVGAALVLFYLLLVSLSEHVAFHWAYLSAALSSTLLIGIYVSGVLASAARGMAITGGLALLYTMLYVILRSEDNALLMGSLLIFAVLAGVMVVTRRFDWYRIGNHGAENSVAVAK